MRFVIRGTRDGAPAEHSVFALDKAHALRLAEGYGLKDATAVEVRTRPAAQEPPEDPRPPEPPDG